MLPIILFCLTLLSSRAFEIHTDTCYNHKRSRGFLFLFHHGTRSERPDRSCASPPPHPGYTRTNGWTRERASEIVKTFANE